MKNWIQSLCQVYDNNTHRVDTSLPDAPPIPLFSCKTAATDVVITLTADGKFRSAQKAPAEVIIPITPDSLKRTSNANECPHPLCDSASNIETPQYAQQLKAWIDYNGENAHFIPIAVYNYIRQGTIETDLLREQIVVSKEKKKNPKIRWIVNKADAVGACWQNNEMLEQWHQYFIEQYIRPLHTNTDNVTYSYVNNTACVASHIFDKSFMQGAANTKLLSTKFENDNPQIQCRFTANSNSATIGLVETRKAENALKWLLHKTAAHHYNSSFALVAYSPTQTSIDIPEVKDIMDSSPDEDAIDHNETYSAYIRKSLAGYHKAFDIHDDINIIALTTTSDGRSPIIYHSSMSSQDYLQKLEKWLTECCWYRNIFEPSSYEKAPDISMVLHYAYNLKKNLKKSSPSMRRQASILYDCIFNGTPIPPELVRSLLLSVNKRKSLPRKNKSPNDKHKDTYDDLMFVSCAIIRKSKLDKCMTEAERNLWSMSLNRNNNDRSYLYGRLLAIAECVEISANSKKNIIRPTIAENLQPMFAQRPLTTWRMIEDRLVPYLNSLKRTAYNTYAYYKYLHDEILSALDSQTHTVLDTPLDSSYVLGYASQRKDWFTKKSENNTHNTNGGNN